MLPSFNRRRRMKAESRQILQKLAARLKFFMVGRVTHGESGHGMGNAQQYPQN